MGSLSAAEPRSLPQLTESLRDLLDFPEVEAELGDALAEMNELLASVDLPLDPDLDLNEYVQTLQHISDVVEDEEFEEAYGFGALGSAAKKVAKKLKPGFKMVFGRVVKAAKKFAKKHGIKPSPKASAMASRRAPARRKPPKRRTRHAPQASAAARVRAGKAALGKARAAKARRPAPGRKAKKA